MSLANLGVLFNSKFNLSKEDNSESKPEVKQQVFLGGTMDSSWRDQIKNDLKFDTFNPYVEKWDAEAQEREASEKEKSDFILYVITPKQEGFYSIAEITESVLTKPEKTYVVFLKEHDGESFLTPSWSSIEAIKALLEKHKGKVYFSLEEVVTELNKIYEETNKEVAEVEEEDLPTDKEAEEEEENEEESEDDKDDESTEEDPGEELDSDPVDEDSETDETEDTEENKEDENVEESEDSEMSEDDSDDKEENKE